MSAYLSSLFGAGAQLLNNSGVVLSGGLLYTYSAGTTTPLGTWTDSSQAVLNANPIVLDSAGRLSQEVWLQSGSTYKFVLKDSVGNTLGTWDNIAGINDISSGTLSEWVATNLTPTYIGATSFSVPGNVTSTYFMVNRRIQAAISVGTVYGYVSASSFGAGVTTVTVVLDTGVLDSGLSSVNVGLLTSTNPTVPAQYFRAGFTGTGPLYLKKATALASATMTDLSTATGNEVHITGTTTITGLGTVTAGAEFILIFDGSLTLTYNVTSLITPNAQNLTVVAGDIVKVISEGSGNWRVSGMLLTTAGKQVQSITASVAGNALTATINPTMLDFRSSTLTSGTINTRTIPAAISVVVPSGAALGTTSAVKSRLALIAIDNAGTIEAAICNLSYGSALDETTLVSTTAISAGATSGNVIYSTTARTSVPFRVVGFIESTQATAGTWATSPSTIQGEGGQALTALSSIGYGQTWQSMGRSSGVTYVNDTGRPIMVKVYSGSNIGAAATYNFTVNGVIVDSQSVGTGGAGVASRGCVGGIVPPGQSYSASVTGGAADWLELR
jgi:hypothetical protein